MDKVPHLNRTVGIFIILVVLAAILMRLTADNAFPDFPFGTTFPPAGAETTRTPPSVRNTPSPTVTIAPGQAGQRVIFTAEDGHELVGYFYPSWKKNAPIVVLMHQRLSDQRGWQESAIIPWMQNWGALDPSDLPYDYAGGRLPEMPKDQSFAVLTFDFRGSGESRSTSDRDGTAAEFLRDARAAYAAARSMPGVDPNHVIGIGASIGADAVVDTCGDGCSGAFSVLPGNWLGMDYGQAARALIEQDKPVRCMYAINDIPSPQTCWSLAPNELYKIYAYPGIKHGMTFFIPRKMEADFGINLLEFLLAAIG